MTHYRFGCAFCDTSWSGDNLPKIAQRAARHYNYEHGSEFEYNMTPFDSVERGGERVHKNTYSYERFDLYLTAYDVLERVGKVDGWLLIEDDTMACERCHRILQQTDERVLTNPDDHYEDKWHCQSCHDEIVIERRKSENVSLEEFA